MSYVVINHREATLVSCNAGHPASILLRSGGRIEPLEQGGTIVGMEGVIPFEEEVKTVGHGDKIIFYTDGLTEYTNGSGEAYGVRRLNNTLKEMTTFSAQETLDTVISSVMEFGNNVSPSDDITIVVVDFYKENIVVY